ncbi:MAG: rhodanese-like domain-containing protein [Myxococcota bacterium]
MRRILFAVVLVACSQRGVVDRAPADLRTGSPDVVVLDVRTPEEYEAGHIEGAINLNVNDSNFANAVSELDHDATYVVHCAANVPGGRAARAIDTMRGQGFEKLENLVGGYAAYQASTER